ncbi:tetratricopeptide repeat protein [Kitasatospora albolonga]|uniref:tetratricopeptide repeat protein n=1 Tax=Kitasatospora albolonga TaxID=68173 RepID=UPI0031F09054
MIASQWRASGVELPRLAEQAEALRDALVDPALGGCLPAHGDGLLLNPASAAEVAEAVDAAFARAGGDGSGGSSPGGERSDEPGTLLLAFVGHGHPVRADDFLFPVLDSPSPPDAHTAYAVPTGLRRGLERHGDVLGLVAVVDACDSGTTVLTGLPEWLPASVERGREVALLTSAGVDQRAYDLAFVRGLNRVLTGGHARLGRLLQPDGLRWVLGLQVSGQQPQSAGHTGLASPAAGPQGLVWVARNAAHLRPFSLLAASPAGLAQLAQLRLFQSSAALERTVEVLAERRAVVLVGHSGQGKSVLAAALCRPELLVKEPEFTVVGLVQLSEVSLEQRVTDELRRQLTAYLPGFAAAVAAFEQEVPELERNALPGIRRLVTEPLARMAVRRPVRVVVDALDQLGPGTAPRLLESLGVLVAESPDWFGVITTARTGLPLPGPWHPVAMAAASDAQIEAFVEAHSAWSAADRRLIRHQAAGHWQLAALLAASGPSADEAPTTHALYDADLDRARRLAPDGDPAGVDALLDVLCAAGQGPALPRPLLEAALADLADFADPTEFAAPADPAAGAGRGPLDALLALLPGLLDRVPDAEVQEYLGIHHQSLLEHLLRHEPDVRPARGHHALVRAIATLAPMDQHDATDPLHAYAEDAEPRHCWELGEYERVLEVLTRRRSPDATVNSERWLAWCDRLSEPGRPGPDSPVTLRARQAAAYWAGRAGLYARSRAMYEELLPLQIRVLGPDHEEVLESRHRIAYATGKAAHFRRAVELHRALLADQTRVLGPDDRRTLETRHHLAYWTGRGGEMADSLRMHEELLADQLRCLEPQDQDVLESRHYIAYWYGRLGRPHEALERHRVLLRDRIAKFGEDHEQVVYSRMNICKFTYEAGHHREALEAYRQLLPEVVRHKGPEHPDTLLVRQYVARLVGEVGRRTEALELLDELMRVQERVVGPEHPAVLTSRQYAAWLHGDLGDTGRARAELAEVQRVLLAHHGEGDHPDLLTLRLGLGWWTALDGAPEDGVTLLRAVVAGRTRALGPDHPETLDAASRLGHLLTLLGGPSLHEASELLRVTVPAQEARSGADHPQTRATRERLAAVAARADG